MSSWSFPTPNALIAYAELIACAGIMAVILTIHVNEDSSILLSADSVNGLASRKY
ncbi:MAG TPA: hypothetical protein VFH34_10630 [Anaerolineales bacterium]|nr:hypothetical protein [Anaerolineales bacterium]